MGPSSAGSRFSTNKRPTHSIKEKGNIFSASITPVLGVYYVAESYYVSIAYPMPCAEHRKANPRQDPENLFRNYF